MPFSRCGFVCLIAVTLPTLAGAQAQFRQFLDPTSVSISGNRRLFVDVALEGLGVADYAVSVAYATTAAAITDNPITAGEFNPSFSWATADCKTADTGWMRCSAILPHSTNPRPNRTDHTALIIPSLSPVAYRWLRKPVASRVLSVVSDVKSAMLPAPMVIVSMGDSYASGEGAPNPDGPRWAEPACHRSMLNGKRLAVERIALNHPDLAIAFADVSCSGSTIDVGIVGAPAVYNERRNDRPLPQLEQAQAFATTHGTTVDIALLSVGGNDVEFVPIIKECLAGRCDSPERRQALTTMLGTLSEAYLDLDVYFRSAGFKRTFIAQVPDLTRNGGGSFCTRSQMAAADKLLAGVSGIEAEFAFDRVILPLNRVIAAAADSNQWILGDGMVEASRTHGICESMVGSNGGEARRCNDRWFSTITCSLLTQGDPMGGFHPTRTGHRLLIASQTIRVLDAYMNGMKAEAFASATIRDPVAFLNLFGTKVTAKDWSDERRRKASPPSHARPKGITDAQLTAAMAARAVTRAEFKRIWGIN